MREVHHFAVLIGFGASAVNAYLAFATLDNLHRSGAFEAGGYSLEESLKRYRKAVGKGLLKNHE